MAKQTTVFTAQSTPALLGRVIRRRDNPYYLATVLAYGTFGGSTLNYYLTPDGGSTLIALKDLSGNNITSTANDNVNINLGNSGHNNDRLEIWGQLTGGSGASVTVALYDNN